MASPIPIPLRERIQNNIKVSAETGCWEWSKAKWHDYGLIVVHGKTRRAHRVSYEEYVGPIPAGMVVCHRCDNPPCVNPSHLFAATQKENIRDAISKGRKLLNPHDNPAFRVAVKDGKTKVFGSKNSQSVLNEDDVRLIRSSNEPAEFLARYFSVNIKTIKDIVKKRTWVHSK